MEKFDMAKFLSDAGVNIDTEHRKQIEHISIDLIAPDPDNFYELSGIEDLAENIALLGLQQPLLVRPMPGDESQVVIISGHRRHAALKLLIEQDGRDDLRDVPCIVERGEENPKLKQLKLIYANASTRVLTSAEQAKQAEQVEKLLYELKEEGMEFPGRMRDHVAQACQMSTGKIARLKVIKSGLIPPFLKLWESGQLNDAVAYVLAGQYDVRQRLVFIAQTKNYTESFRCTSEQVTRIFDTMEKLEKDCASTACTANFVSHCDHIHTRLSHAAGLAQYESLDCRGCCKLCQFLKHCKFNCEWAACEKKELKEQAKAAKLAEADAKREVERPEKELLEKTYARIKQLRADKDVSAKDFSKASSGYDFMVPSGDLERMESGAVKLADRMPGGIWAHEAKHLIATADLLGCSIDYLLGRADTPDSAAAPAADPGKCVNVDTWHTGDPPQPGWYICRICIDGVDEPQYWRRWFSGKTWKKSGIETVTHWVPVVEEFE